MSWDWNWALGYNADGSKVKMLCLEPLRGVQVQVADREPGHVSLDIWKEGGGGLNLSMKSSDALHLATAIAMAAVLTVPATDEERRAAGWRETFHGWYPPDHSPEMERARALKQALDDVFAAALVT